MAEDSVPSPTRVAGPTVAAAGRVRVRVRVEGIVQGVGFRPFVHALATGLDLGGFVGNDARGVFIDVEGPGPRSTGSSNRWSGTPLRWR